MRNVGSDDLTIIMLVNGADFPNRRIFNQVAKLVLQ